MIQTPIEIDGLTVRKAKNGDVCRILEIIDYAREQMIKNGNPTQWPKGNITAEMIEDNIGKDECFVIENGGRTVGTFVFFDHKDPTYDVIEDGEWKNDNPYCVIHRVASDGTTHGIVDTAVKFALLENKSIRIDTHRDNKIMQKIVTRLGFEYCGIIYVSNGTQRLAYQKN